MSLYYVPILYYNPYDVTILYYFTVLYYSIASKIEQYPYNVTI
jgi:hypothetical protein